MSGRDYLHIWYQGQLGGALLFLIATAWWNGLVMGRGVRLQIFFLALVALGGLIITLVPHVPRWLKITDIFLQTMMQPIMLNMLWGTMTRQFIVRIGIPARGALAVTLLYYLVMFAPFASEIGGQIKNVIGRIVYLIYLFMMTAMAMPVFLPAKFMEPLLFRQMIETGFWGTLAFLIAVTVLMRVWHLSWPGLKPSFGTGWNWWVFATLMAIYLFYELITFAQVDWHELHLTRKLAFTALEAGIAEETLFRFGVLGVILYAARNLGQRVPIAVGLSSLCFGLLHMTNVMAQHWDITVLQTVFAVALGMYFAVVYLYTGQLWLVMLMHFITDAASFSYTQQDIMTGHAGAQDWIFILIVVVYFMGVAIWMMFGQRRVVMERHADRFTGEQQHFDYSFNFQ